MNTAMPPSCYTRAKLSKPAYRDGKPLTKLAFMDRIVDHYLNENGCNLLALFVNDWDNHAIDADHRNGR